MKKWEFTRLEMQKFYLVVLLFTLLCLNVSSAQKTDYQWILGTREFGSLDTLFGIVDVNFNYDPPRTIKLNEIDTISSYNFYHGYNAITISDEDGDLLFYTNGCFIKNRLHQTMENGALTACSSIYSTTQQVLILPFPGSTTKYVIVQDSANYCYFPNGKSDVVGVKFYYSIVDMSEEGGLGAVVMKRKEIVEGDSTHVGKIAAVKHANGRDWWILKRDYFTHKMNSYLLTPDGVEFIDSQSILPISYSMTGQALFSPDGTKYLFHGSTGYEDDWMLYQFDRCSGVMSKILFVHDNVSLLRGAAFSPNSRFLYSISEDSIIQYDLMANNIYETRTVVGIHYPVSGTFGSTRCYSSMLGPDGKIYWSTTGGTQYFNVIDNPDELGVACGVRWREYKNTLMSSTTMNYPNYRLGPVDGSLCDTLGIDNIPLADFRVRRDSTMEVIFVDRSAYNPTTWYWTFGDGMVSQDTSPKHLYLQSGIYEVCQTVSNSHGSDSFCRTINILSTTLKDPINELDVQLFPNPVQNIITVNVSGSHEYSLRMIIYNLYGNKVLDVPLVNGFQVVDLTTISAGIFICDIKHDHRTILLEKILKLE